MNKIIKLEDMIAWQKSRELVTIIYQAIKTFPKEEEYNIKKHMRECSRNIPANLAEGFGRFNYKECVQFYRIARGSLYELKSDLLCSYDLGYIDKSKLNETMLHTDVVGKLINGLISNTDRVKKIS